MQRDLCWSVLVPLWQRGLTWRVGLKLVKVAESLLVLVSQPVLLTLGIRGAMGDSVPDVLQSTTSSSSVVQVDTFSQFLNQWRSIFPTGLCFVWLRVTIFSLGLILPCSVMSSGLLLWQSLAKETIEPFCSGAGFYFQCVCS